jgi:Anti-sigma-K factor rskA
MDHAAAHERIADLALEARGLDALTASTDPADAELRDHLAGCEACRAELDAWQGFQQTVTGALRSADDRGLELSPILPPESLRARVLGTRPGEPTARRAGARPTTPSLRLPGGNRRPLLLGLAAAVVVAIVGGGIIVNEGARLAASASHVQSLAAVIEAVDRVLAEPEHRVVQLRTAAGAAGGSVSWSRHDLVVLTTSLAPPAAGQIYRCWLAWDGRSAAIGAMDFEDGTAYWIGSLDDWAAIELDPGTQFLVTLEPGGPANRQPSGPTVLEADLGA